MRARQKWQNYWRVMLIQTSIYSSVHPIVHHNYVMTISSSWSIVLKSYSIVLAFAIDEFERRYHLAFVLSSSPTEGIAG